MSKKMMEKHHLMTVGFSGLCGIARAAMAMLG
jgi:hypothetical protein